MKIKILKNKHYPFPYFFTALPKWVGDNTVMKRQFMFDESCLYDLHSEDQLDINKLFGFSIGWHHHTSFRFGWRPNIENKIEIFCYEYQDGIRQKPIKLCEVDINKWIRFQLTYSSTGIIKYFISYGNDFYWFYDSPVNIRKKTGLGYTLGLYFGGNQKAPHDIIIYKIN
jgi:hypothetical protein